MSRCPNCRKHYRELEDEQGDHPCPSCGFGPGDDEEEDEEVDTEVFEEFQERIDAAHEFIRDLGGEG